MITEGSPADHRRRHHPRATRAAAPAPARGGDGEIVQGRGRGDDAAAMVVMRREALLAVEDEEVHAEE